MSGLAHPRQSGAQVRRAALAKIHIARKELGLDDAAYRAMLERVTGRTSAADCDHRQLGAVLDELKAKGWGAAPARKTAQSPAARKARALWISLHQLGVVRNPSEKALEAFGARQLGVAKLQWADDDQMFRLIEALKAMAGRAGWDQSIPLRRPPLSPGEVTALLKRRLEAAIARRRAEGLIR